MNIQASGEDDLTAVRRLHAPISLDDDEAAVDLLEGFEAT